MAKTTTKTKAPKADKPKAAPKVRTRRRVTKAELVEYVAPRLLEVGDRVIITGVTRNGVIPHTEQRGVVEAIHPSSGPYPVIGVRVGGLLVRYNSNQLRLA